MTTDGWVAVVMWSLVVIISVASVIKYSHLNPTKARVAKRTRVTDSILIAFTTAWAIQMFSRGELAGWIVGGLMTTTVTCCIIEIFILNRYLDRTKGDM